MDNHKKNKSEFALICLKPVPRLFLVIALLLITSCATTSKHISNNNTNDVAIVDNKRIIIMPAILKYESIFDDAELSPAAFQGEESGALLMNYAARILSKEGFDVLNADALTSEDLMFKTAYNRIIDNRIDLFRSSFSTDLSSDLKVFCEASNNTNILVLLLRVKVGPSGTWDLLSGAITSESSYTRLKAVLVETKSGRIIWKNQIQLREIPKPQSPNFIKSSNLLFQNLKSKKEL